MLVHGKPYTVHAYDDASIYRDDVQRAAPHGRTTHQGGFYQQKKQPHKPWILVIDPGHSEMDESAFGIDPYYAGRRCRWCAGDGLDPFVARRTRQLLRQPVDVWHEPTNVFGSPTGVTICIGVCIAKPLMAVLWTAAQQGGVCPLERFGLELGDVACPRCGGYGSLEDGEVVIAPGLVLQS